MFYVDGTFNVLIIQTRCYSGLSKSLLSYTVLTSDCILLFWVQKNLIVSDILDASFLYFTAVMFSLSHLLTSGGKMTTTKQTECCLVSLVCHWSAFRSLLNWSRKFLSLSHGILSRFITLEIHTLFNWNIQLIIYQQEHLYMSCVYIHYFHFLYQTWILTC